ncbi:MAG: YegS/Rv2252/BmrU family lipid kinase [Epulopiscium sp.]|nr:YegS/Rv2252/BmrU family lipid kinase [Candidatus Epulonipiscium sp.]
MKKIKLFYNPVSGDKSFLLQLDIFIQKFQGAGYDVSIFRSSKKGEIGEALRRLPNEKYSILAVAGGDGTVNEMVDAMIRNKINIPLGIFPVGTANDFGNHLNLPRDVASCCEVILRNNLRKVDIGNVNGKYFINVCSGGLFTNVSQSIDINFKNTLGKLAYYIKGIEQLPNFKPIHLKIETPSSSFEDMFYLFLVLNGNSAGGFDRLAKNASVEDGIFDFIGIKAGSLHEIAILFLKILKGEHLDDANVLFLRESKFRISCLEKDEQFFESDVDGEGGPALPLDIEVCHKKLQVFANI